MKLRELNEVKVFQNNFIKVGMVEDALKMLFPENTPSVKFDEAGLYIVLDSFDFRDYENKKMGSFTLTDAGIFDERKNIKKYYVEYFKSLNKDTTEPTSTTPTEETPPAEPTV